MNKVLVTGANGFVGRSLCRGLVSRGLRVVGAARSGRAVPENVEAFTLGEINSTTRWDDALKCCQVVVHLAARVHLQREVALDPLSSYRCVNTDGAINLALQAASAGVKRFIFLSSIGVNGSETFGTPFVYSDKPNPHSDYAVSKHEAEIGLLSLSRESGMEVVIIRAPLIYGLHAPGNFSTMLRWLKSGFPLPLGMVTKNRRSFVAVDNLVDLIMTCVDHPAAANQTFLVSDGEDLSTTNLLRRLAGAMGTPSRLLPIPPVLLKIGAQLFGKSAVAQRLVGDLQVEISHTCQTLGWKPPVSVDEGLRRAAKGLEK